MDPGAERLAALLDRLGVARDDPALRVWRAPGRVNLIGEHIDYTGGTVLPFACDIDIVLATVPHSDAVVLTSLDIDEPVRVDLRSDAPRSEGWGRYAAGVVRALRDDGFAVRGFRGVLSSTIPVGAGLSSSAALEAAIALALLNGERPAPAALQRAELLAVGVPCGVMDQIAVLHCVRDHALAIDCSTETWRQVALPPAGFVVIDTGTRRSLEDGRYAQRRAELERGHPKRVRHVATEKERVLHFLDAMAAGDLDRMGSLLDESHTSLRDAFEVSSPELDRAVEVARLQPTCLGARLVGAGFAGCVLALVRPGVEEPFSVAIERALPGARAMIVGTTDGAGEIRS